MSKYSTKPLVHETVKENKAGGFGYSLDSETEFATLVLTSFMQDKFYETEAAQVARMTDLHHAVATEFTAQLALYARNEHGLRSVSHFLGALIAPKLAGATWGKWFYQQLARRPDDMAETIAAYFTLYPKRPLPNALKKGFALAFKKFTRYQLAKYQGSGKSVSLVDVARLVHPKQVERNENALTDLVKGSLKSFDTWEAELSEAGKAEDKIEEKKKVWAALLSENKLGYFALLHNLRNILEQAPECIGQVCEALVQEDEIRRSLVLPFRFLSALEELDKITCPQKLKNALSKATDLALANVSEFLGKTLVVLDVSGSMTHARKTGAISPAKIGGLFASALVKKNAADLILFAESAAYAKFPSTDVPVLTLAKLIPYTGGGTNFGSIFATAKGPYDRVIILTDMQGWMEDSYIHNTRDTLQATYARWKQAHGCNPHLYMFDLNGYGETRMPQDRVFLMAGFSEKSLELMKFLEEDKYALVNKIKNVQLAPVVTPA